MSRPKPFPGKENWRMRYHDWMWCEDPASTACKHGQGECERCGTTDARDALHRTDSRGRGVVGKVFR